MPFAVNGQIWGVAVVHQGDPRLVDRTGAARLAVTDPATRTVYLSSELEPPLLDQVALHEAAHVVAIAGGMLAPMRALVPSEYWVPVEEWAAKVVEMGGIEAVRVATEILGRDVCVRGLCVDKPGNGAARDKRG